MFHIRALTSRAGSPKSVCGERPEMSLLGHFGPQVIQETVFSNREDGSVEERVVNYPAHCMSIPMLTEWAWVKGTADSNKGLCAKCVAIMSHKPVMPGDEEEKFDDSLPF